MGKLTDLKPQKIAILRALQLGDLLCSIPAIRALKNALPEAGITLLGLPWAEAFVSRFSHYFTGFIHFPGYPGLPEQPYNLKSYINFLEVMNDRKFDLVIQMQGNGTIVNSIMELTGACQTAGYYLPYCTYCPDQKWYMPYQDNLPEIRRHIALMDFIGVSEKGEHLEMPVTPQEEEEFDFLLKQSGLNSDQYIIIHTGARDTNRCWPLKNFAHVAEKIAEKGYEIVLTGTEPERERVSKVKSLIKNANVIDLAGQTNLGTLTLLVKNAKLLFSNDTGISHIASATQTPSVIIVLSSDPNRWAPLNRTLHRIILPSESDNMDYIFLNLEEALKDKKAKTVVTEFKKREMSPGSIIQE